MDGEDSIRLINVSLTKRSFQPSLYQSVCNFRHKPGHYKRDCQMVNGLCLACGTRGYLIRDCPFRKIRNIALIRPTLPAPVMRRNLGPVGKRTLFLSQWYSSNQVQRRPRGRTSGRKRQMYNLTEEGSPNIGWSGNMRWCPISGTWILKVPPVIVNPNLSCPELINFSLLQPLYLTIITNLSFSVFTLFCHVVRISSVFIPFFIFFQSSSRSL